MSEILRILNPRLPDATPHSVRFACFRCLDPAIAGLMTFSYDEALPLHPGSNPAPEYGLHDYRYVTGRWRGGDKKDIFIALEGALYAPLSNGGFSELPNIPTGTRVFLFAPTLFYPDAAISLSGMLDELRRDHPQAKLFDTLAERGCDYPDEFRPPQLIAARPARLPKNTRRSETALTA